MDQNISSLLCQLRSYNLRHGHYFHASFLWMGVFNVLGPLFGLPFVTGSLPHSPQFVRALTCSNVRLVDEDEDDGIITRQQPARIDEGRTASNTGCHLILSRKATARVHAPILVAENRIAPLLTYAMLGLPLLFPALLQPIPRAAINGVLAYVGVEGIISTTIWERTFLFFTPTSSIPPSLAKIGSRRIHLFTLLQLVLLSACWVVNLSPLGLCVAFLIVALVPFRLKVLPSLFTAAELAALDTGIEESDAES